MSNYTKTTDFEAKDSLPTGDSGKIIRGSEFETEFDAISTAIATKADTAGPTFTGTATFATTNATTVQIGGVAVTSTAAELNTLDGITSTTAELNKLDGFTGTVDDLNYAKDLRASGVTAAEFDILDGLTATATELNILDGATLSTAELNLLDGVTSTTAELNILDGVTATATEINLLDGVTATTAELNILDGVTSTATELNILDGVTATTAELNYVDGVTSAIQTQIDTKAPTASPTFTGTVTVPGLTTTADVSFGDNDKAIFGAGSDLQIYHDTEHSFIKDAGTGHLKIQATNLKLQDVDGNNYIDCIDGSYVRLMHNTATKLETTSTGIDVTGVITTDGMTTSADINFGDNAKATFGAASDLQIYHDGSDSIVKDAGTGNLKLQGSSYVVIQNTSGTNMIRAQDGAAVRLYHNGSEKLDTTSTGIDVTGTVTADGLTVDGNNDIQINRNGTSAVKLFFDRSGTVDGSLELGADENLTLSVADDGRAGQYIYFNNNTKRVMALADGGDISFYEDTGTTAKLFWDASAESLGIGTSEPSTTYSLDATKPMRISSASPAYELQETDATNQRWSVFGLGGDLTFRDITNNVYAMTLKSSSGNVGIGTTSPTKALHVVDSNSGFRTTPVMFQNSGGIGSEVELRLAPTPYPNEIGSTARWSAIRAINSDVGNATDLAFLTNDVSEDPAERMRIDHDGNVGIGTSSPSSVLHLSTSNDPKITLTDTGFGSSADITGSNGNLRLNSQTATIFDMADSEVARINSAGNVGIGTSSPDALLDLDAGSSSEYFRGAGNSGSARYLVLSASTTTNAGDTHTFNASSSTGHLQFATAGVDRVTIDNSGNVGIGTSSPATMLELAAADNDGTNAPRLRITNSSTTLADGARVGTLEFHNSDTTGSGPTTASIEAITNSTDERKVELTFNPGFNGATTEAMRIDSDGNVGINGQSSPSYPLDFPTDQTGMAIRVGDDNVDSYMSFSNPRAYFGYDVSANSVAVQGGVGKGITFNVNDGTFGSGEAMRIDSSGNLLVGTTSQSASVAGGRIFSTGRLVTSVDDEGHYFRRNNSDGTVVEFAKDGTTVGSIGVSVGDLYIQGPTSNHSGLRFDTNALIPFRDNAIADGSVNLGLSNVRFKDLHLSGDLALVNSFVFGNTDGLNLRANSGKVISMQIAGSEKARLDSSGNLLVGKTSASSATVGFQAGQDGFIAATRTSSEPLVLNRLTSDGTIASFRKDSTTVGSIGVDNSDNLFISGDSTHAGLQFGTAVVAPHYNGGLSNNVIDLGTASNNFKDLYLSGGVYLGGTGSAHFLDDYEEGTWTPTVAGDATGAFSTAEGTYTKVGRLVFIEMYVVVSTNFTSNYIGGLPFTVGNLLAGTSLGQSAVVLTNAAV